MSIPSILKVSSCIAVSFLLSCGSENSSPANDTANQASSDLATVVLDPNAISTAAALGNAYMGQIDIDFSAAFSAIDEFAAEVERFLASPDETGLEQVRERWVAANSAYELTTLHRYFADAALAEMQTLQLFQLDYQLNHWPILPGYIDYVSNYPDSGIVNDMTVALEPQNLRSQHGAFDVNEAAVGFHVLEFLLWGENNSEQSARPASDFSIQTELSAQQQADGMNVADLGNNRRRELLQLLARMLQEDFAQLTVVWSEASGGMRPVSTANAIQTLESMVNGMIGLLSEEILASALYLMLNGEFDESRPSLFSDTSQNAVSAQLTSLELLLLEIGREEGDNLDQLLNSLSADYEEYFLQNLDASKECLVILYSSASRLEMTASEAEFKVVECINSLTNMIDYLERAIPRQA